MKYISIIAFIFHFFLSGWASEEPLKSKKDQLVGIGAQIKKDGDGFLVVHEIVRGGAAWKQGELKKGDRLIIVTQGKNVLSSIFLNTIDLNQGIELIRGKINSEVTLTVEKPSGNIEFISMRRDVINIER